MAEGILDNPRGVEERRSCQRLENLKVKEQGKEEIETISGKSLLHFTFFLFFRRSVITPLRCKLGFMRQHAASMYQVHSKQLIAGPLRSHLNVPVSPLQRTNQSGNLPVPTPHPIHHPRQWPPPRQKTTLLPSPQPKRHLPPQRLPHPPRARTSPPRRCPTPGTSKKAGMNTGPAGSTLFTSGTCTPTSTKSSTRSGTASTRPSGSSSLDGPGPNQAVSEPGSECERFRRADQRRKPTSAAQRR